MNENPDFKHPVVVIAIVLVGAVILMIAAALFGFDRGGFVAKLSQTGMARGLITYLFAVTTIGVAIIVVVMGLTGGPEIKDRFDRGKEVLALLLGVFGTIVGYYYGSAVAGDSGEAYRLTPVHLSAEAAAPGEAIRVTAYVSGGIPPYEYRLSLSDRLLAEEVVRTSEGWIDTVIAIPPEAETGLQRLNLETLDAESQTLTSSAILEVLDQRNQ